jgi:hypothetical protein
MRIWGIHKKHPALSWFENFMGGHINIGKHTIYGENAMNWAVNISTKKGWLCFTLPTWRRIISKDEWYIYLSPNGAPGQSYWYKGTKRRY